MTHDNNVKQRVERKYEHDDQVDAIGNDYAGQLSILFCQNADYTSDIPSL